MDSGANDPTYSGVRLHLTDAGGFSGKTPKWAPEGISFGLDFDMRKLLSTSTNQRRGSGDPTVKRNSPPAGESGRACIS